MPESRANDWSDMIRQSCVVESKVVIEGAAVAWIPVYTGMTVYISAQRSAKVYRACLLNALFDKKDNNKKPLETSGLFDPSVA